MRLQLVIPENTFLTPVAFNRMLSLYGATAIFFFALPLVLGLFYYVAPLQIGARGTALPRLGQIGALALGRRRDRPLRGLPLHPVGGRRQPAGAAHRGRLPLQQRRRRLGHRDRPGDARLRLHRDRPARRRCARCARRAWPGGALPVFAWAGGVGSWLMLVIGPVLLAALTMLMIDRNYDGIFFADGSGGAPLLWQHLSWIFFTGAYMLVLIFALRRDRRNRRHLLPQTALQPRRRDGLAGRDRRDRHPGLDAEHADRADRDRLDVLRDADVAGADRPLRPDLLQPDRDHGRRHAADAGAAAVRRSARSR